MTNQNNNFDLKNIWQQQIVSQPNFEELNSKLKQFKQTNLRKIIVTNVLFLATSLFIGYIWYNNQLNLFSTKLGIILTILAMFVYIFAYNSLFTNFNKIDHTQNNSDYLQSLSTLKVKQKFMQTTMLSLYFILLSLGICLYMYEPFLMMPMAWGVFAYAITIGWIGFNWLYIRPKTIAKQATKLDELITSFEEISKQLKEK